MTIHDDFRDPDLRLPLDDAAGPALPLSSERAAILLRTVLDQLPAAPARAREPRPLRRRWFVAALAAALALVAFGAIALAYWRAHRAAQESVTPSTAPQPTIAPPPQSAPPASPAQAPAEPPSSASSPLVRVQPPAASGAAATSSDARSAPVPLAPAPKEPDPDDLLRQANSLRVAHRWADAEHTYQKVIARAPASAEAYTATVAAASIRLEHLGDPAGALRSYRAAISQEPRGALGEEAGWGIAEAYRALGDSNAEIDALRDFTTLHPQSLMRPSAEKRLRELGVDSNVSP